MTVDFYGLYNPFFYFPASPRFRKNVFIHDSISFTSGVLQIVFSSEHHPTSSMRPQLHHPKQILSLSFSRSHCYKDKWVIAVAVAKQVIYYIMWKTADYNNCWRTGDYLLLLLILFDTSGWPFAHVLYIVNRW